jgi:hypothetical protein
MPKKKTSQPVESDTAKPAKQKSVKKVKPPEASAVKVPAAKKQKAETTAKCGLCGKTKKLTKTECCGNWICDDEHKYVMFSYAHTSCHRNHRRYTLCAYHFDEGHEGHWKECKKCRKSFDTEMYVYYCTNEHNFEVLANPPTFKPTKCTDCGKVIIRTVEGYMESIEGIFCNRCTELRMRESRDR